jgi:hypothetical protein
MSLYIESNSSDSSELFTTHLTTSRFWRIISFYIKHLKWYNLLIIKYL